MLPQKLFFRIGEVAGLVGVEPHVLRYWEREFRSIRPTKSAKGQRVYSRKDVENLLRVRDLLYRDGFTIAGAKKKLQRGDDASVDSASEITERVPAPVMAEDGQPSSQSALESAVAIESAIDVAPPSGRHAERRPQSALEYERSPQSALAYERSTKQQARVREKLLELRSEVEAFLAELSASPPPRPDTRR